MEKIDLDSTSFSIVRLSTEYFQGHKKLMNNIINMIEPNYEDPRPLVVREFNRCDTLYLVKSDHEKIIGCLMASWEKLTNEIQSVYLGLGMVKQNVKNTGILKLLFTEFIKDAQKWKIQNQQPLIIWATTATPFAYFAITRLFESVEPSFDGTYSENSKFIAALIRKRMNWCSVTSIQNPFVINRATRDTYYSEEERKRITQVEKDKNFSLFSRLNINEARGDRLLLVFQVPSNRE
jgi:hypothetical protein